MLVTGALAVLGGLIALRRRREHPPEPPSTVEPN
jgi:hypothetical protein